MGGGFGGFKDFEDEQGPNTDEDLQDDPLMQMDMPVSLNHSSFLVFLLMPVVP
jgi:hypothetical protein